ncbi:tetratricopeptide repeat protein [Spongiimicrobium sp. 2-473A-2-J]|uniref:tetratricopeptide repeat protein n=1 Tax=Eudoraea algarum TaxID=3417568 RepID=UPI003D363A96
MKIQYNFVFLLLCFSCANLDSEKNEQANALRTEAKNALEQKDFRLGIVTAKKALELNEQTQDTLGMVESLYLITRGSAFSGNFKDAVIHGERASALCKEKTYYEVEYKINNMLSWSYFDLEADFRKAMVHQKRQLFVVNQLNDDAAKALVYNNYGYDGTVAGTIPLEEALKYSEFANEYYAKTENNNGRWYTLMNLTWQHRLMANFEKSEQYGKLSVNQADQDKDRHAIIEAYTNLGETYLTQEKIKEATPLYTGGLEISQEKEDRDKYVFDIYYSKFLWMTGEKEKAISILKQAIAFLETSEVFYEMLGRAYLAEFYSQKNEDDMAMEQIQIIEHPRNNYISFETKCLMAMVKAKIMSKKNQNGNTASILESYRLRSDSIGTKLLTESIRKVIEML